MGRLACPNRRTYVLRKSFDCWLYCTYMYDNSDAPGILSVLSVGLVKLIRQLILTSTLICVVPPTDPSVSDFTRRASSHLPPV